MNLSFHSCSSFDKVNQFCLIQNCPKNREGYKKGKRTHKLDERGIHYYFQYSLNDYEAEGFEPNVPILEKRIETFKELSIMVGQDRVIWRFDPLVLTSQLTPRDLLKKIWRIGNAIKGYTNKLVFSFVDVKAYRKVQNNLVKETGFFSKDSVSDAELSEIQVAEIAEGLSKCRDRWIEDGWYLTLATCAEQIDLNKHGIEHNKCIDGELIEKLWSDDKDLVYYLRTGSLPQPNLFGSYEIPNNCINLKDKGQRKICGCMVSKDIGMYNTCKHFCVYCYANTSKAVVQKNTALHNDSSESIIE